MCLPGSSLNLVDSFVHYVFACFCAEALLLLQDGFLVQGCFLEEEVPWLFLLLFLGVLLP